MKLTFTHSAWEDYLWFQETQPHLLRRLNATAFKASANPNRSKAIYPAAGQDALTTNIA